MLWPLYQLAYGAALIVVGPFLWLRRRSHYGAVVRGRLGLAGATVGEDRSVTGRRPLWLHAVSVGEVGVAATLARALPADLPLLVTTVTPTGQARAAEAFAGRATVAYLPLDLGPPVRRFFARYRPAALVLVEGDYWPLLLEHARRAGLPVAAINGRVGDASFRRMRRLRPLARRLLDRVDRFGLQTASDRDRLLALGVPGGRLEVTGNLKYDTPEPAAAAALERLIRDLAGDRPVLVAGSTMAGEEKTVVDAFERLGGADAALLVLAPRHPERWDEVAATLRERGVDLVRRSHPPASAAPPSAGRPAVLLLDSLGELAGLYRLAAAAFIGGTLVATGGHNPLEAARFGVPVAVGPSMENFRDMAARFDREEAWRRVADAGSLARAWQGWLADRAEAGRVGGRGARLVEANRGAVAATLELLAPLLDAVAASEPAGGDAGAARR